ncbi:MAG: hypothetical protein AAF108_00605 [Planctomycetota bacterium]
MSMIRKRALSWSRSADKDAGGVVLVGEEVVVEPLRWAERDAVRVGPGFQLDVRVLIRDVADPGVASSVDSEGHRRVAVGSVEEGPGAGRAGVGRASVAQDGLVASGGCLPVPGALTERDKVGIRRVANLRELAEAEGLPRRRPERRVPEREPRIDGHLGLIKGEPLELDDVRVELPRREERLGRDEAVENEEGVDVSGRVFLTRVVGFDGRVRCIEGAWQREAVVVIIGEERERLDYASNVRHVFEPWTRQSASRGSYHEDDERQHDDEHDEHDGIGP